MSDIDDGAAFVCSRCDRHAARYQGRQWLCAMHYRFGQMRAMAKRRGKEVPSHELLHELAEAPITCADCGRDMTWLATSERDIQATLQHYRDGTMALVCLSCNTRHAFAPGDSYRDQPKNHKFCPACKQVKPLADYSADNGRGGPMKIKSWCKPCSDASTVAWAAKNRDRINERQRTRRAMLAARKTEPKP